MKNSNKANANISKTHEKSEILSDQRNSSSAELDGKAIAGFPWQFTLVVTVIALGIVIVILKGSGIV